MWIYVLLIVLACISYAIPVWLRSIVGPLQGLAAAGFAVTALVSWETALVCLPLAAVWLFGSVHALSLHAREEVREEVEKALRAHKVVYHENSSVHLEGEK